MWILLELVETFKILIIKKHYEVIFFFRLETKTLF